MDTDPKKTLGEILSPVLEGCAEAIADCVIREERPTGFTGQDMLNALDIFVATALEYAYRHNREKALPEQFGESLADLVKVFTGFDPRTDVFDLSTPEVAIPEEQ